MSLITAGSYSRIAVFESCKLHAKLKYIDKIPEKPRPPLPNGKEHANDRGSRVHDDAELFVRGDLDPLPVELKNFEVEFNKLRSIYTKQPESVLMEDMWCFNNLWEECASNDYDNIWMRIILDNCYFVSPTEAVVIDYKTGKRQWNEVKHAEQTQLYQLAVFLRFPEVQHVTTELWYLDLNELVSMKYRRNQGMKFLKRWNDRMSDLTTEEIFDPKPSMQSCRFCPYKTGVIYKEATGTGDCELNP